MKTKKKGLHVHRHPIFHAKSSEDQKKKGLHVHRHPIFHAKLDEDQKKGLYVRRLQFSSQNQVKRASWRKKKKRKEVADVQLFARNEVQKIHLNEILQ